MSDMNTGSSTDDDNTFDETPEPQVGAASPFGQLRQQHQKLGEERHLDLEVPGYNGILVARYKMVPWEVAKDIGERTQKSKNPRKELLAQCSLIVHANEVLLMRDDGELKRFQDIGEGPTPELPEDEITWASNEFDACMAFDPPCNTSRERVLRTFRNDLAVAAHHQELTEWLQDSRSDDDEGFTESS